MDGRPSVFRRREGVKDLHVHVYYHVLTRNFFVYYEIDNDESKHALALSEHGYLTATRRCKARGFCWSKSEQ